MSADAVGYQDCGGNVVTVEGSAETAGVLGGHAAKIRDIAGTFGAPPASGLGGDIDSLISRNHESTQQRLNGAADTVHKTGDGNRAFVGTDENNAGRNQAVDSDLKDGKGKSDLGKEGGAGAKGKLSAADIAKFTGSPYQSSMPGTQTASPSSGLGGFNPSSALQGLSGAAAPIQSLLGTPGTALNPGSVTPLGQALAQASAKGMDGGPASLPLGPLQPGDAGKVQAIVNKELGTPYAWGAGTLTGPSQGTTDHGGPADANGDQNKIGYDCSGFSRYVTYQAFGVEIPKYSYDQMKVGTAVSLANARVGDLVFPDDAGGGHVAIYMGRDEATGQQLMAEAPSSGQTVKISPLRTGMIRTVQPLAAA